MKNEVSGQKMPDFLKPFFWSYDFDMLDIVENRRLIIKNILDYGTKEATDWLNSAYDTNDIREVIENTPKSAWGKKSIALWSLVYKAVPKRVTRFT